MMPWETKIIASRADGSQVFEDKWNEDNFVEMLAYTASNYPHVLKIETEGLYTRVYTRVFGQDWFTLEEKTMEQKLTPTERTRQFMQAHPMPSQKQTPAERDGIYDANKYDYLEEEQAKAEKMETDRMFNDIWGAITSSQSTDEMLEKWSKIAEKRVRRSYICRCGHQFKSDNSACPNCGKKSRRNAGGQKRVAERQFVAISYYELEISTHRPRYLILAVGNAGESKETVMEAASRNMWQLGGQKTIGNILDKNMFAVTLTVAKRSYARAWRQWLEMTNVNLAGDLPF